MTITKYLIRYRLTVPALNSSEESKELKFFTPDELKILSVVETHIPILEEFFPEVSK